LNFDSGLGEVILRKYSPERGGFWEVATGIYKHARYGVWKFRLPGRFYPPAKVVTVISERGTTEWPQASRDSLLEETGILAAMLNSEAVQIAKRDTGAIEISIAPPTV
jgi:hypothetical protein